MSKLSTVLQLDGSNQQLANFLGPLEENLRQIADSWGVQVVRHGFQFCVEGDRHRMAANSITHFFAQAKEAPLALEAVQLALIEQQSGLHDHALPSVTDDNTVFDLRVRKQSLRPRTPMQRAYLNSILQHDISFGIGPAGTGKTWLAVACAVDALERDQVQRIILTRPAVEAGERLGFLPGDLAQKVDPYLRPLYDALYDLMGFEKTQRLFEKQTIEIAPLAYMRGRTLNNAFIILDEAQNTTPEQMKMFLTRIGFGSKAVITGDLSQIDLPKGQRSGLGHAVDVLHAVAGIATTRFSSQDVVRHPLVARIVDAYDRDKERDKRG